MQIYSYIYFESHFKTNIILSVFTYERILEIIADFGPKNTFGGRGTFI